MGGAWSTLHPSILEASFTMEVASTLLLGKVNHAAAELCGSVLRVIHARVHEANPGHLLLANTNGQLYEVQLAEGDAQPGAVTAKFEMYLASGNDSQDSLPPLYRAWACFECQEDGVIFAHQGSCNLLFVALPTAMGECSGAFLFGSHTGEVRVMTRSHSCLVSGAADGGVRLWDLAQGQLLHSYQHQAGSGITALEMVGPLMVAMGDSLGLVTLFDLTARRLTPTSRFHVDQGPVTCLAAGLTFNQQVDMIGEVRAPRAPDGGGVVAPPIGSPWRTYPYNVDANREEPRDTLLAVASEAGWLHVYAPRVAGEFAWRRQYSGVLPGKPFVQFSRQGNYLLLVTGGPVSSQVMLLSTASWIAHQQWELPKATVAAGLMPPYGDLAVFPDTLQPATRLIAYACPSNDLPVALQAKLPAGPKAVAASYPALSAALGKQVGHDNAAAGHISEGHHVEDLLAGQQFLHGIHQLATEKDDASTTYRTRLSPQKPLPGPLPLPQPITSQLTQQHTSLAQPQRARLAADIAESSGTAAGGWHVAEPGMLPHTQAADSSSGSELAQRLAAVRATCLRPSTLPAGRSWLGAPAPEIDLSDVLAPPAPRTNTVPNPAGPAHNTSDASGTAAYPSVIRPGAVEHGEQHPADEQPELPIHASSTQHSSSFLELRDSTQDSTLQRWIPAGLSSGSQAEAQLMQEDGHANTTAAMATPSHQDQHPRSRSAAKDAAEADMHYVGKAMTEHGHTCREEGWDDELRPRALPPQLSGLTPSAHRQLAGVTTQPGTASVKHEQAAAAAMQQPQPPPACDAAALPQPHVRVDLGQNVSLEQHTDEWEPRVMQRQDEQYVSSEDEADQASQAVSALEAWQQQGQQTPPVDESEADGDAAQGRGDVGEDDAAREHHADTHMHAEHQGNHTDTREVPLGDDADEVGGFIGGVPQPVSQQPGSKHDHGDGNGDSNEEDAVGKRGDLQGSPVQSYTAQQEPSTDVLEMPDFVSHVPTTQTSAMDSRCDSHSGLAHAGAPDATQQSAAAAAMQRRQRQDGGAYGLRRGNARVHRPRPVMAADPAFGQRMHVQSDVDAGLPGHRSPYRGYKPNMAVLLKELRARNTAARKQGPPRHTAAAVSESGGDTANNGLGPQSNESRSGISGEESALAASGTMQPGMAAMADAVCAADQARGARPVVALHPPKNLDTTDSDIPQHGDQRNRLQHLQQPHPQQGQQSIGPSRQMVQAVRTQRPMTPPASSLASPMLMGSPTSTVCRQEALDPLAAYQTGSNDVHAGQPAQHTMALDSSLAQPHLNSSLHLMARIDALQQGRDGLPPVRIDSHEHAELVRRAADLTVNVPPHVQLYHNLQQIGAVVFAPKPVKQLHPNWVASRNIRPEIGQLWDAQEQQRQVMSTRGVALYTRPTPAAVASAALELV